MAGHVMDPAAFRGRFPAFTSATAYPDATLDLRFTDATMFLGAYDGCVLAGDPLQLALYYMTAHLLASADMVARGQTSVVVTGSTVDKVQVQLQPPPTTNAWQWWLYTTPYGMQLWALLSARAAGGFYVGGSPERSAFRTAGGRFGGRRW